MRKVLLSAAVVLACSTLPGQPKLEKMWESDSVTLKGPESATYDAKSESIYVSSMNSGSIVRMATDGKIIKNDWVTGLNANKGIGIFKGFLYTAETAAVAVIDIKTATVIKRIPIKGAVMLNDLAVDRKGIVYVSDTRTGKIHRVEGESQSVYIENIPGANGLLPVNDDLYLVGSSTFQKINSNKEITKISDGFESGLDGIVMISKNEFILSNYKGIIYYVNSDGSKMVLLDSRADKVMANDISYDSRTKTMFVPSFSTNRVAGYKVK